MIGLNEPVAAPCDPAPPLGPGSDRRAAQYYRAQHGRAVQREQQWKARSLAAERTIAQLMVLVGGWVRQIEALKGQLAWLKKQQFGRKSEATPANGLAGSPAGATKWSAAAGSGEGPAQGAEPVAGGGAGQTQRRRGQQPGRPGPKRQRRLYLPEETFIEFLSRRTPTKPVRATKRRFKFDWAGGLADSKRRFTRVELQHHGGHRVVARRCCRLIGRVNGD